MAAKNMAVVKQAFKCKSQTRNQSKPDSDIVLNSPRHTQLLPTPFHPSPASLQHPSVWRLQRWR